MRNKVPIADQKVARIAGRQWGNVTIEQLLAAGLSRQAVARRVEKGLLHPVYRAVYRVGHTAPSLEADYMAAVFACGEGAVLSGRAAAFLYGVIRGDVPTPEVTVTADRRLPGITIHRVRNLDPRDRNRYKRIPITSVARTLVDLAAHLDLDALAKACHEAGVRHRLKPAPVKAALTRKPNATGAWKLHEIFTGQARVTLSRLEEDTLALLKAEGLPLPLTNRPAGGRYVDCRWPEYQLTVELDSYTYHHSRHAWEQDRRREREARARGDEFRRYTYGDVYEDRSLMLAELRVLLRPAAA